MRGLQSVNNVIDRTTNDGVFRNWLLLSRDVSKPLCQLIARVVSDDCDTPGPQSAVIRRSIARLDNRANLMIAGLRNRSAIDHNLVSFHRLALDLVIFFEIDPVFDVLADADFLRMG